MIRIEQLLHQQVCDVLNDLYQKPFNEKQVQIQPTRKEFEGDFTLVVFPLLKLSGKNPELTGKEIAEELIKRMPELSGFNQIKGFLNLSLSSAYWFQLLQNISQEDFYGFSPVPEDAEKIMVEFSSPNTNKPLHLGHIRNILLGDSIVRILRANGKNVYAVNLVNDRGIHICKSMIAWQKFGQGATPDSSMKKGDHLVGDYYVKFDLEYRKEVDALITKGVDPDEAKKTAPLLLQAQEMLRKWEMNDPEIRELWKTMNSWVYDGFDVTYEKMGIEFDKIYYESDTYKLGKDFVLKGLENGHLDQDEDKSIWADLTNDGLDRKLLLRSDGTSVYMTQDVGTAYQRFHEYSIDQHIYVVGNEQNYHFQVLKLVLKKLGFDFYDKIYHLSYGMVELPDGKMKSREGKVVDADDLIQEMVDTARQSAIDSDKLGNLSEDEFNSTIHKVAMAALKYFILKVDPKKNMTFSPEESIDFNGNTGPFIQYTFARIQSVLRNSANAGSEFSADIFKNYQASDIELGLIQYLYQFPVVVNEAGANHSPAMIANYLYGLAKEFNRFYHEHSILKAESEEAKEFRLVLAQECGKILKNGLSLLGIESPDRM